jgi:hypothetical protein
MFARRADPRPFCARLLQLRAAQRSCAAGKTPQKSAGLRTTTLHSVGVCYSNHVNNSKILAQEEMI